MPAERRTAWREAERGKVHDRVIERVMNIVRSQFEIYDRFIKLGALYDPNGWAATSSSYSVSRRLSGAGHPGAQVIENAIASNVDAITGSIAAHEVRARFMTDGALWKTQRLVKHLEFYAEELDKYLDADPKCRQAFHEGALKGTGVTKTDVNAYGEVECTQPLIDDIIVDEGSLQPDGQPLEMHQRHRIDRDELAAQYPKHAKRILAASPGRSSFGTFFNRWIDDGRLQRNQLGMLESHYLPIGRKGRPGYRPGRHVKVIDGLDILDEEYEESYFPVARFVWTHRYGCWYGISGAERIVGHQKRLNKHNWQFDRILDQNAVPTTWVRPADANLQVQTVTEFGTVGVYHAEVPKTITPNPISPQHYQRHADIRSSANEEFGQSRMATGATKPAGIDSGVALREYKDQTTQRFATQEGGHEALKLRTLWLGLMACRKLGSKAPTFMQRRTFGVRRLEWSKVDPEETKVRMHAASNVARTPAGRTQFVLELAQGGIVSQDEARRLLRHPDAERALSLYTAALENIERALEDMLDGEIVMPHPYMNLRMCVWRGQAQLNLAEMDGFPEHILEAIRQFTVTAAYYLSLEQQGVQQPGMASAAPAQPDVPRGTMGPAGAVPALPPGPPQVAPIAALAPQAMELVAR